MRRRKEDDRHEIPGSGANPAHAGETQCQRDPDHERSPKREQPRRRRSSSGRKYEPNGTSESQDVPKRDRVIQATRWTVLFAEREEVIRGENAVSSGRVEVE